MLNIWQPTQEISGFLINVQKLVSEYNSGKSVKQLSEQFNIDRGTINRRLRSVGITSRNRSESMYLRMSLTTTEERQRLTLKARIARGFYSTKGKNDDSSERLRG